MRGSPSPGHDLGADGDPTLATERLTLAPVSVADAPEMTEVLGDAALHRFTGGAPPSAGELADRYAHQQVGRSPDGTQRWHNWIVRRRSDGAAIGYVQATTYVGTPTVEIAWVVGTAWQGRGYAKEAAAAMCAWLTESADTIPRLVAHIHPDHAASAAVAASLGLHPTSTWVDAEVEWVSG